MTPQPAPCPSPENPCMCRCHLDAIQRRDAIPPECADCAAGRHLPKYVPRATPRELTIRRVETEEGRIVPTIKTKQRKRRKGKRENR